jgi:beta-glucanase (GH16 family)
MRADFNTTPTNIAGRDWYQRSCRITTQGKRSIQYGKIEARIQMPNANGSWPAFWMLGDACAGGSSTSNYAAPISYYDIMINNWASCGEVDIMEHKNSETTIYNNIFWDLRTGLFPWTAGQNANYVTTYNGGNANVFHVYAIEWTASQIRWTRDGAQTHLIDTTPGTLEEFRRPFHIILNLALGGAFPAMDPVQSQFPLYMNVDYVRYYQLGTGPTAIPPTTPPGGGSISPTAWYSVHNRGNAKCVDARSSGTANGTAIQQYTCNSSFAQQYQFQPTSGGYYRVNNRNNSAQVWDVSGVSTADNALIHLWSYVGGNNQQWLPVSEGGGFWHFVARHSGKCLDVPAASTANSVQLVQYTCNGTGAQSFSLQAH